MRWPTGLGVMERAVRSARYHHRANRRQPRADRQRARAAGHKLLSGIQGFVPFMFSWPGRGWIGRGLPSPDGDARGRPSGHRHGAVGVAGSDPYDHDPASLWCGPVAAHRADSRDSL